MDKEQFEKEADECGMMDYFDLQGDSVGIKMILDMVNDAVAAERDACAKVCDAADKSTHPADLADAIRARK
jgi:hypothetical protein